MSGHFEFSMEDLKNDEFMKDESFAMGHMSPYLRERMAHLLNTLRSGDSISVGYKLSNNIATPVTVAKVPNDIAERKARMDVQLQSSRDMVARWKAERVARQSKDTVITTVSFTIVMLLAAFALGRLLS